LHPPASSSNSSSDLRRASSFSTPPSNQLPTSVGDCILQLCRRPTADFHRLSIIGGASDKAPTSVGYCVLRFCLRFSFRLAPAPASPASPLSQLPTRIGCCVSQLRSWIDLRFHRQSHLQLAIQHNFRLSSDIASSSFASGFNLRFPSAAASFRLCQATQTFGSFGYQSSGRASELTADFHRLLILRLPAIHFRFPLRLNPQFRFLCSSPTLIGFQPFSGSGDQLPTFCGSSVAKNLRTRQSVHASGNHVTSVDITSGDVSDQDLITAELSYIPTKCQVLCLRPRT
jgi:hypothetical protein